MRLKISTPERIVYQGEIKSASVPTENGILNISPNQSPMVNTIKPGLIKIIPFEITNSNDYILSKGEILISIDKGLVFVDGNIVRILCGNATTVPNESSANLSKKKQSIEDEIKKLRSEGSIEELDTFITRLQKIEADISLEKMKQLA